MDKLSDLLREALKLLTEGGHFIHEGASVEDKVHDVSQKLDATATFLENSPLTIHVPAAGGGQQ